MIKYKRKDIEKMYSLIGKYWNTTDTDYLDLSMNIAHSIDKRLWCEIHSLVTFAVRKKAGISTLIDALKLFGYEVEDEADT